MFSILGVSKFSPAFQVIGQVNSKNIKLNSSIDTYEGSKVLFSGKTSKEKIWPGIQKRCLELGIDHQKIDPNLIRATKSGKRALVGNAHLIPLAMSVVGLPVAMGLAEDKKEKMLSNYHYIRKQLVMKDRDNRQPYGVEKKWFLNKEEAKKGAQKELNGGDRFETKVSLMLKHRPKKDEEGGVRAIGNEWYAYRKLSGEETLREGEEVKNIENERYACLKLSDESIKPAKDGEEAKKSQWFPRLLEYNLSRSLYRIPVWAGNNTVLNFLTNSPDEAEFLKKIARRQLDNEALLAAEDKTSINSISDDDDIDLTENSLLRNDN